MDKDVLLVNGDIIRPTVHSRFAFSPKSIKNSHTIINLCREKNSLHDYIIVSVIAPFEERKE